MSAPSLTDTAENAACGLIEGFLEEARAACERLKDPQDEEALHDFRVALRRLRSTERAYRSHVAGVIGGKLRKRIKSVASATGPARDAEVQLAWLEGQREMIKSHERPGFQWLYRRLRERTDEEYAFVREHVTVDFERVYERLKERLGLSRSNEGPAYGDIAAGLIRAATAELAAHLGRVHGESDEGEVHQARIAGKRIRYLLEPVRDQLENGKDLVKELKALQDLLGELHDIQVLSEELRQAAEEAGAGRFVQLIDLSLRCAPADPELEGARRRDERAGLMSLARELHERRQDLFGRLLALLERGDAEILIEHLGQAADRLSPPDDETDDEDPNAVA
jgi:CHAD domain-containing protein